jgi:hypothetical protein
VGGWEGGREGSKEEHERRYRGEGGRTEEKGKEDEEGGKTSRGHTVEIASCKRTRILIVLDPPAPDST